VIIPIIKNDDDLDKIKIFLDLFINGIKEQNIRYNFDDRLNISPGFKFNEWEMKGVPIRVEVGPRDMKSRTLFCARRDTGEKKSYNIDSAASELNDLLDDIQNNMFEQAHQFLKNNTTSTSNYDEFKSLIELGGFICSSWDGNANTESAIKRDTKATIRCILSIDIEAGEKCIYSGEPAKYKVVFARAY